MKKSLEVKIVQTENGFIIEANNSIGGALSYGWGKKKHVAESESSMKSKVNEIIDSFSFDGKKKEKKP